jgi:hypothetical protein
MLLFIIIASALLVLNIIFLKSIRTPSGNFLYDLAVRFFDS